MEERRDIGIVSIDSKGFVHLDFLIDSKYFDDIDMVALQTVVDHLQIIINHVAKNIEGDKDDE